MRTVPKIVCICACLLIGISVFLPFFSASALGVKISKSMMDVWEGIAVLVFAAAAVLFSVLGKFVPVAFLGLASLGLLFLGDNSIAASYGNELEIAARYVFRHDLGFYGLLIGSAVLIVFAVLGLAKQKKA